MGNLLGNIVGRGTAQQQEYTYLAATSQAAPPVSPEVSDYWFDPSDATQGATGTLKQWDGATFNVVVPLPMQTVGALDTGQVLLFDPVTNEWAEERPATVAASPFRVLPLATDAGVAKVITVGPGGDYATLAAAEAGERVADSPDRVVFDVFGGADGSASFLDGTWGTTPIEVWMRQSEYHFGVLNTGAYHITGAISHSHSGTLLLDGIQFDTSSNPVVGSAGSGHLTMRRCIIKQSGPNNLGFPQNGTIHTCLFILNDPGAGGIQSTAGVINASNCSVVGTGIFGYVAGSGTLNCVNCLADLPGNCFIPGVGGSNNASQDGSAPGANSKPNATFAFRNAGGDDYRLAPGDIGAAGLGDPSGDSYAAGFDVEGTAWPNPPAIGFSEPG